MTYEQCIFTVEDGVATLTLNRPEKLNALSHKLRAEVADAVAEVGRNDDIKVLVLTGTGRGFCTGADVSDLAAGTVGTGSRAILEEPLGLTSFSLRVLPKPVIAAVNGTAAGGGFGIALASDIRIAAESARFIMVFVRRGLIPDAGNTYFLPRLVGTSKALEIMFSGEPIDAQEALRLGIVNKVVPDAELMPAAQELAHKIAHGPSLAIELTKQAVYEGLSHDLLQQLRVETAYQRLCMASEDHQEGVLSFREKRPPQFKGK